LYVALSTLDNLKKGGRVTGAKALIASALQIFPIIELKDGDISVREKVRGEKAGRRRIVELVEKDAENLGKPVKLGVIYTRDKEVGEELKGRLQEIWKEDEVKLVGPTEAGAILGVHAGPGAGAVAAFWNPPGRS
jgi:DegV family protein with EDD domain